MRISQTGIRSPRPVTRFPVSIGRQAQPQLGLRRGSRGRLEPAPTSVPAAATVATLHAAARGLTTIVAQPAFATGAARVADLRRIDAITWSQPNRSATRRPRSRSAAPWRG